MADGVRQNLIPLILLRPLQVFFRADQLRQARIILLKVTHSGYLLGILTFEKLYQLMYGNGSSISGLDRFEFRRKLPCLDGHQIQSAPSTPSTSTSTAWDGHHFAPMKHQSINTRNDSQAINEAIARLSAQVTELQAILVSHRNGRHYN